MDGEKRSKWGILVQREKSQAEQTKVHSLFGKRSEKAKKTEQQPVFSDETSSVAKKFVPTCNICGEKH